jgi:hypothetical protein
MYTYVLHIGYKTHKIAGTGPDVGVSIEKTDGWAGRMARMGEKRSA